MLTSLIGPATLWALDPAKSVFQYNVQNWSRQNGLPANQISAVTQSLDGFIWLGTQNGLVRFDGLEFQVVPITLPQARNEEVRSLYSASAGGVWFANKNGGFGYFDGQTFSPVGDARWNGVLVRGSSVIETRDGKLWTGTERGWGYWDRKNPQESVLEETVEAALLCFHQDHRGWLWKGTSEKGVSHWAGGKWVALPDPELQKRNVFALAVDAQNTVWVGTERGLRSYDENNALRKGPEIASEVKALLVDRHGVLWVGTSGLGLGRYEGDVLSFFTKADGLGSDNITSLYEDAEGSLWVGSQDGLSQLSDLKFPLYTTKEGLCEGSAHSVALARDGGLWVCSQGLSHITGNSIRAYRDELDPLNHYLLSAYEVASGQLYLVDGSKTLGLFSNGKITTTYTAEALSRGLIEDAEGVLAGVGPLLCRFKEGKLQPYAYEAGQAPAYYWINNLATARDGSILVSSNNGVYRVKDGRTQNWTTVQGLSSDRINWVSEDADGALWIGLLTGMARIKDGKLVNIRKENGLGDERVYAIVQDDHECFWISSGQGIYRVPRKDLNDFADGKRSRIECAFFNGLESVKFSDHTDQEPSGCKTPDGRIWFPNPQGVLMIDPDHFFINKVPPPVNIHLLRVDGIEVLNAKSSLLKTGIRRVEFSFSALSYISPKKIQLRYELEGIDPTWVEAGTRRTAQYTNLGPGRYKFNVQACNADGVWSTTGAVYSFELLPSFFERPVFIVCCGAAAALAIFGGFRWKVRNIEGHQKKLQADNDLLETKVAERTAELAREHALLRALLDHSPDQLYFKDAQSRFLKASQALAVTFGVKSPDELVGKTDFDYFSEEHARPAFNDEQEIMRTGVPIVGKVEKQIGANGAVAWVLTTKMALKNSANKIVGTFGTSKDITPIKDAEAKLDQIHKELLDSSRRAGMAEVATNVLHNVGNVLNSVNVSTTLVAEQVRGSRVHNLGKISALLLEHEADLGSFVTNDPRGKRLSGYIKILWDSIAEEQCAVLAELDSLCKNVEHIKNVVATQQSYAKVSGVTETLPLIDLLEDALRMNIVSLERQALSIVRDYQARPTITLDKHKVIHTLVNLIKNAGTACVESGRLDKVITLQTIERGDRVSISISDNGVGIPPENLTRIFAHGFTTRKDGHGFGLHSGALAAKEIGGSLQVRSEGPGKGATFTLELPLAPAERSPELPALLEAPSGSSGKPVEAIQSR